MVATITTKSGCSSGQDRHFILKNFSIPMSAPNPASVNTKPSSPTSLSAIKSANEELAPWAIFANGPENKCLKNFIICKTLRAIFIDIFHVF